MTNPRFIFSLLFIFFGFYVKAQDSYAVLSSGDTLYGDIVILSTDSKTIDKITLKSDKKKVTYNALQVIRFRREGDTYQTIKFGEKYTYMKLIKEGYLSLYTARYDNSSDFSISIFKKMDGEVIEIPNLGFKKYLSEFLSECSDVQSGILNGTYKRKDLDIIQEEFNNCIEEKTQLINNTESKTDSEPELSNPKLDELISKITSAINNSDIENKSDVLEIIDAINKRKQSGESIPNYLSNSLVNELEGHEELTELANELINF